MSATSALRVEQRDGDWVLTGPAVPVEDLRLCNDYLGYLADRHYAAGTRRSYAFARWLIEHDLRLEAVDTVALLRCSWGIWPARSLARRSGCGNPGGCRVAWIGLR